MIDLPIYNAGLININRKEIKRYAGLAKATFDESSINQAALEAQILAKVQGVWEVYDYDAPHATINMSPPVFIEGEKIKNFLAKAEKLIFLSATIGEEIEASITNCFKEGRYAYSLLLDAAATTAIEEAADIMEKNLRQTFQKKGYRMLPRFSPGYGDWDICFQPTMLKLAHADEIGIKLTESYMLVPRKSITAVIGLVPAQLAVDEKNSCNQCTKNDCLARKEISL